MKRGDTRVRGILGLTLWALASACASSGPRSTIPEPRPHAPTDAVASLETLRIGTLNMWGVSVLGFDVADDIDARFAALTGRLAENAPGLDVMLLQEAWKDAPRRRLLADPGVARTFPFRVDGQERFGGTGLVILSRLPFSADDVAHLRFERQGSLLHLLEGDVVSGKGVLAIRVRANDRDLWIANTHLIACYPREHESECDEDDPNGKYRWDQVRELRAFLARVAGDTDLIAGGDFNFTRASRYYRTMIAPESATCLHSNPRGDVRCRGRRSDFAATLSRPLDARGWRDPGECDTERRRLDYLWQRPAPQAGVRAAAPLRRIFDAPVVRADGTRVQLSDHPALMGVFSLGVGGPRDRPPTAGAAVPGCPAAASAGTGWRHATPSAP